MDFQNETESQKKEKNKPKEDKKGGRTGRATPFNLKLSCLVFPVLF